MKRIAISLAIFLSCVSIGSTIAMVNSNGQTATQSYSLGTPMLGDVVEYDLYLRFNDVEQEGKLFLQWAPSETLLLADGYEKRVNVLESVQVTDKKSSMKTFFDPETNLVIGSTTTQSSGFGERNIVGGPIIGENLVSQNFEQERTTKQSFSPQNPCLPSFQEKSHVGDERTVSCGYHIDTVLQTTNGLEYSNDSVVIRYSPGIPYPEFASSSLQLQGALGPIQLDWRISMTGFSNGSTPLIDEPLIEQAVQVEVKRPEPWLLSDAGATNILAAEVDNYLRSILLVANGDRIVILDRFDQVTGELTNNVWSVHYDSGNAFEVSAKTTPGIVDSPIFVLEDQYSSGFGTTMVNAPDMDSLAALWLRETSQEAEFNWASMSPDCDLYEGDSCSTEYYRISLAHGTTEAVPYAIYNSTSIGMEWTPTSLAFYQQKADFSNAQIDGITPYSPSQPEDGPSGKPEELQTTIASVGIGALAGAIYFLKPALVGLFSREMDDPLDHPARASIMATVQASPGVHFQEIRRQTKLAAGTTQHHIRMLEGNKQLIQEKALGKSCYFPRDRMDRQERLGLVARQDSKLCSILDALTKGPTTMSEVAKILQVSASTANHHVSKLQNLRLVRLEKIGRTTWISAL